MRLIKKKLLLLLIVVFTVSTAVSCGQRNPEPSEAGASFPEGTAQTEESQAGLADDSLSKTNKCLTSWRDIYFPSPETAGRQLSF